MQKLNLSATSSCAALLEKVCHALNQCLVLFYNMLKKSLILDLAWKFFYHLSCSVFF